MEQINLSGGRFNYIRQGEGAAVLLVHGLGSSLEDWQPQVEALSRHFRVYALDLRGHGASEPLRAPVSMGELAADVAEFIVALDLEPCILVGISMGGMITFQLLAEHAHLRAAAVINSSPCFPWTAGRRVGRCAALRPGAVVRPGGDGAAAGRQAVPRRSRRRCASG